MRLLFYSLIFCCCQFAMVAAAYGQEEAQAVVNGRSYIDINLRNLDKYNRRIEHQQQIFLNRLKRREQRFARQLKQKDSTAYARYQSQPLNYDSISRLLKPDSAILAAKTKHKVNKAIDSLRGVQAFIQANAAKENINTGEVDKYSGELSALQQKLSYREYISGLINQHTNELKSISSRTNIPALTGIEQQTAYYKGRLNAWKEIAEEPSKMEERALEYLQGSAGFDQALSKATTNPYSMQAGMDADALAAAGFQTKASLNKALQQKLGGNIGQVQQQMGSQVSEWQNKAQSVAGEVKQVKQTAQQIKNIKRPSFKINPMRGKPFRLRLQKQYDFQTLKATDGKPALLSLSAGIGYRQTMKVSYGIAGICNIGLGQNWSNISFSFQGFGLRAYARWQWIYGIGGYGAYERTWKQDVFTGNKSSDPPSFNPTLHNTSSYTDACLIGIEKQYKISTKYNGSVQLLADIWWKEKGLRSPLVLRFTTTTK